jgi:peptidoglycan L-alanyl-D-glutamate endopeptidase CwlK
MFSFGKRSESILMTCDERLRMVAREAILTYDFAVISGHRTREEHQRNLDAGTTTVPYEKSKHSLNLSHAIDLAPWPIDWQDTDRFFFLAGVMFMAAKKCKVPIRWGGDWNRDFNFKNQNFFDLPHFELVT